MTAITVLALAGCAPSGTPASGGDKPTIRVGSTNFSEQVILGELYSQGLENAGYKIERRFNLGNREIVGPALESGQIDLVGEYLATYLAFLSKNQVTASPEARATADLLKKELDARKLTALDFAPAVDTNGFAITKESSERLKAKKLSDLTSQASTLVLGGPPECPQRPFCALGLKDKYGMTFKEFKPLDAGGPLTIAALENKSIDVALVFTTDAAISQKGLVLLEDDKKLQLADNVVPVIRNEVLAKGGDIRGILNNISSKLTTEELTGLNKQVGVDRMDPRDAASAWLKAKGLIKA